MIGTFCVCGKRVERYPDLDGLPRTLERSPIGTMTFAGRFDGALRVSAYDPREDDGTDIRFAPHVHATTVAA